jgi:glucose/arabinose dehydrogenase
MTHSFRIPAVIVGIVAALALVVAVAGTGSASTPAMQGDANCNGTVDVGDALSILLQMTGAPVTNSACVLANSDTDCDGDSDEADALAVLSHVAEHPDAGISGGGCVPIGGLLATATPTPTLLATIAPTPTDSGSSTPLSDTPSPSAVVTDSATPTATATATATPDSSGSPTVTLTATPTLTPAATPTLTPTPTPTATPTHTLTPTPTATPVVCGSLPQAVGDVIAAGAAPVANGYTMTKLPADAGVDKLTNVVPVPGDPGLAIITSEPGKIWVVCLNDDRARVQIADFTDVVRDKNVGQETDEGLTGLIFEPGDPSIVYMVYSMPGTGSTYMQATETPAADAVRSRIARYHIVGGEIDRSSEEIILDIYQSYKWHQGDDLAFGPDGMLYIATGDSGFGFYGQTLSDLHGAILRIDVHSTAPYTVPTDNPFYGQAGKRSEIWSYGFRNPWRFSFDGSEMWITDVGERSYEEVNIGEKGANYGWHITEGHICAPDNNATPPPTCNTTGLETPRAVYAHGANCAITGGHVYRGDAMPELDGYYIYGDWCSGRIWALDTNDDDSDPIQLADTNMHPVSWAITNEGEIVAASYFDAARPSLFPPPPPDGLPGIYKLERLP